MRSELHSRTPLEIGKAASQNKYFPGGRVRGKKRLYRPYREETTSVVWPLFLNFLPQLFFFFFYVRKEKKGRGRAAFWLQVRRPTRRCHPSLPFSYLLFTLSDAEFVCQQAWSLSFFTFSLCLCYLHLPRVYEGKDQIQQTAFEFEAAFLPRTQL